VALSDEVDGRLGAALLTTHGIPADRGWSSRDEKSGEVRGAKKMPALTKCTIG